MAVLLVVSSLSCWSVSRRACNPCWIRSSKLPTHAYSLDQPIRGKRTVGEGLEVLLEMGLGTGHARRSRQRCIQTRCRSARTRTGVGLLVQPDDKPTLYERLSYSWVLTWASDMAHQLGRGLKKWALSAMADTGRLNTILESMACWHKQWLHGKVRKRGASDVVREVGSTYLRPEASRI